MKNLKTLAVSLIVVASISSCKKEAEFVDLNGGGEIAVVKDEKTKEPVTIYVKTSTKDTIYAPTGEVINNKVVKTEEGKFTYDSDGSAKMEEGDHKIKLDEDGEYKEKDGDYKLKIDKDGDVKMKNGDITVKTDGETGVTKVKRD
jgi:hypothetical protein